MNDRVIERIAAIAAAQVGGVVRTGSRWDRTTGRELPHVTSRTAGSRARLLVETAVTWPSALGEVAARVQDAVTDRLRELAGIDADAVDVIVVRVVPPAVPRAGGRTP